MLKEKIITYLKSPATNLRLLYVLSFASGTSWIPFFGLFLKEKGLPGSQIGYVSSLIWLVLLIFQPFWGIQADRIGRVKSYRISLIMTLLTLLLFFFFGNSVLAIIICTILCSLFYIAILPLLDTLVLDHVESEHSKLTYGDLRFWGAVGAALGAQVSSLVMSVNSTDSIFIVGAAFLVFTIPLAYRIKKLPLMQVSMRMEFKDLKSIFRNKILVSFLVIITLVSIAQTSIWYFITMYLKDIGASDYIAGSAITIDGISELPFYFLAALLFRKIGIRYTVLLSLLATALRLYFYSINSVPANVLLIETMNGLSWTLLWVGSVELINQMIKPEWRATGQSLLWAAYYGAGQIAGNIWTGHLYERMSLRNIYAINGSLVLVVSLFAFLIFYFSKDKIAEKPDIIELYDNN